MTEQERFERHQAASCGTNYANFKAMADNNEKLFGCRYPEGSRNDEDWQLWQAATAQAVPEGFVLVPVELTYKQAQDIAMAKIAANADIFEQEHRHTSPEVKSNIKKRVLTATTLVVQLNYKDVIQRHRRMNNESTIY